MGSSYSHSHQQVKPVIVGSDSFGRELDNKNIENVKASLEITHGTKTGIFTWWKHLLSRLTPLARMHSNDGTLTPKIQRLDSILTNETFDSDNDTPFSSMNHHSSENDHLSAQGKHRKEGSKSNETWVLVANNSSPIDRIIASNGRRPTKNEHGTSSSKRSQSPAVNMKRKGLLTSDGVPDPKLEEISIARAELVYSRATWRMYERITSSRTAAAVAHQRFCLPAVLPLTCGDTEERYQCSQKLSHHKSITDTGTSMLHDQILGCDMSVDRHHICFEMDYD